jgi:hypothetical protein
MTRGSGDAAEWQAAAAWREAKQSCAGCMAVDDGVKWQGCGSMALGKTVLCGMHGSGRRCEVAAVRQHGAWQNRFVRRGSFRGTLSGKCKAPAKAGNNASRTGLVVHKLVCD